MFISAGRQEEEQGFVYGVFLVQDVDMVLKLQGMLFSKDFLTAEKKIGLLTALIICPYWTKIDKRVII